MPESDRNPKRSNTAEPSPSPPDAFGRGDHSQNEKPPEQQQDGKQQPAQQQEKKPFWKRPILLSVMIAVAVVGIVVGIFFMVHLAHFVSTDDAFIDGRIAHIAPRVAGKVLELKITDNQIVSADQVLLVIDPAPFEVKLHQMIAAQGQAEAQLEQAVANLEVSKANAAQADADVVVAQANSLNAKQDFERFNKIPAAARSQQQLDQATANQRSTDAQVTAAQKKADSMHAVVKASEKTVDAATASVQAAKAQVEQARLDLSYTRVVPGHSGRVTRRTVEVGDYVAVGQEMLDIVPTDVPNDIWVTANFKETQLDHMERGQPVEITVDAYPDDKLRGHIDSIQNGTGAVFSLLPAENATGNYVKVVQRVPVKIVIDEQPRHMLSPGMSVEPEVDVREHNQSGDASSANASN
jgi:membrane fusion protein (multidrug efflux system)